MNSVSTRRRPPSRALRAALRSHWPKDLAPAGWTANVRAHFVAVAVAAFTLGCSETPDPAAPGAGPTPLPSTPFIVSNPLPAAGGGSVAYLSLARGVFEPGSSVILHAPGASSDTTLVLDDDGMNPVAVPAAVGDTLTATVQAGPTAAGQVYQMLVPDAAAPVVVRVEPHDHKLNVSIDRTIELVFSEPVSLSSLAGSITLTRSGATVAGTIESAPDGEPNRVRFIPAGRLAPLARHELRVKATVRDLDGDSLGAPYASDFTTDSTPPPGPPVISIVRPAPGDSQLGEFFRAAIRSRSGRGHLWIEERLINQSADTINGWTAFWPQGLGDSVGLEFRLPLNSPPGAYSLLFLASDSTDQVGVSAPVSVVLATPDSSPRLEVLQFFLVEIGDDWTGGSGYAPQLVVSDAAGESGVELLGFELLGFADWPNPFPPMYANRTIVPAGPPTSLFGSSYGQHEIYFSRWDGQRMAGPATARIAYRDRKGGFHRWTFQGPVVPLPDTLPPPAVCGRWALAGVWVDPASNCGGSVRIVAPRPGKGPARILGEGTPGEVRMTPLPGRGQGKAR